jgi:hypothetical protein
MPKKFFGSSSSSTSTGANSTTSASTVKNQTSSAKCVHIVIVVRIFIEHILFSLSHDSMEITLRRAGDLAFLFQNYEFAYGYYYAAKRDLSRDQAATFYAGVLVCHSSTCTYINTYCSLSITLGNVLSS